MKRTLIALGVAILLLSAVLAAVGPSIFFEWTLQTTFSAWIVLPFLIGFALLAMGPVTSRVSRATRVGLLALGIVTAAVLIAISVTFYYYKAYVMVFAATLVVAGASALVYFGLGRFKSVGRLSRALAALAIAFGGVGALYYSSLAIAYLTRSDFSKAQETVGSLDRLIPAIDAYAANYGRYPAARSMEELRSVLVPQYLSELPLRDGWDRAWHFEMSAHDYRISSLGADDRPDTPSAASSNVDVDIILHNGEWVSVTPGAVAANSFAKRPAGVSSSN